MTTIHVLIEERTVSPGLKTEHGLSLLLEAGGKSWLFDAGRSDAVVLNSRKLGVDLTVIEGIILSHGHYDHTGGLREVLKAAGPKNIYAHPDIFRKRFNLKKDKKSRSIGSPWARAVLQKEGAEFNFSRERREISPRMYLSGEIPLVTDFEKGDPEFIIAGHCTGKPAEAALSRHFGVQFKTLQAGLKLVF